MKVKNVFFAHFWLKALALALAIVAWLYINGELGKVIKP